MNLRGKEGHLRNGYAMPGDFNNQSVEVGLEAIRLHPCAEMQVQSLADGMQARHKVRFIGFIKGKSLLVTLPFRNGERMWMEEQQDFIVSGFNDKYAYAFTTQMIRARAHHPHPFSYLHFSWPRRVECHPMRNSLRMTAPSPASIYQADGVPVAATMLNLSTYGAMLDSPVETGAVEDHVRLGFAVGFEGDAMNLSISAEIRKIYRKENEAGCHIGLRFENVSQSDALILHHFINTVSQEE